MSRRAVAASAVACSLLFVALGLLFLRYTGAQYDEVLFGGAIYPPIAIEFSIAKVPIMLMTYVGALKSWLYQPWLAIAGSSHTALRLPMLLAAGLSVGIFFLTVRRLTGYVPALLAALLLATDNSYVLTSLYDWGPVALQHLFFTVTLYAGVRFAQEDNPRWLWLAGLAMGLQLWDKAVHLWLIGGFGLALLLVFPGPVFQLVRRRRVWLPALGFFVLGALPLIVYNVAARGRTFTSTVHYSQPDYAKKIFIFDRCLAGDGLFGFMTESTPPPPPKDVTVLERISLGVDKVLSYPRYSLQHTLVVLSMLAVPVMLFGPLGRVALWIALGSGFTCAVMFSIEHAGGALHHDILLWPMPQFLVALAVFEILRRWKTWIPIAVVGLAIATNLLVMNSFLAEMVRHGPTAAWTDALRNLIRVAGNRPGKRLAAPEWGILEQIRFFGAGRLGFYPGSDGWLRDLDNPDARRALEAAVKAPETLFIVRPEGSEIIPGTTVQLMAFAQGLGYSPQVLEKVADRHGRVRFQLIEFHQQ